MRLEILILNSNRSISGMVTNICEKISGGVIIADKISAKTTKCFLYFFNISAVIKPTLVKKYTNRGNSNTNPAAITTPVTVDT